MAADILAIFIAAENRSADSNFVIVKPHAYVRFGTTEGSSAGADEPGSRETSKNLEKAAAPFGTVAGLSVIGTQVATAAGALAAASALVFVTPAAVVVAAPLIYASLQSQVNADAINQRFRDQELQTTTLAPGASAHGFLYVVLPNGWDGDTYVLHIEAIESKTHVTLDFAFRFTSPRRSER